MPYADLGEIELCYQVSGPVDGRPLLLVHGLGAQMTAWYPGFCQTLEHAGFRLIRFDNRDAGLSSDLEGRPAYTLRDMADDAIGLLDHLGYESVHVAGQSMGGMIAQELAIHRPGRIRSMCSIYSAPNASYLAGDETFWSEIQSRAPLSREHAAEEWIATERRSGLDGFSERTLYDFATALVDRSYRPKGLARQMHAMCSAPDRTEALSSITTPTAVIHGLEDRVVDYRGGIATASAVPNAELHLYSAMGHQITPHLWPDFTHLITRTADRADARARDTQSITTWETIPSSRDVVSTH